MRPEQFAALSARTSRQHGLIAVRQLADAHVSKTQYRRALSVGVLTQYRHGVLRVAGAPNSGWTPLMAACLAAGPNAAASHLSAAEVHESQVLVPNGLEITTFGQRAPQLEGVRQHQTMAFADHDLIERHGIPVTSPARTALDLASMLSLGLLARTMDDFCRRRLCTVDDYVEVLDRLGGRGRRGTEIFRLLAEERLGRAPEDSGWARRLVSELDAIGLLKGSVEQHLVTVGKRDFLLDRAWPDYRVGLEFDGFDSHSLVRTDHDNDRERDLLLESIGWRIHRATSRTRAPLLCAALRQSFADAVARLVRDL